MSSVVQVKHLGMKTYGRMEVQLHPFLISARDWGWRSASRSSSFLPPLHVNSRRYPLSGWAPEAVWKQWSIALAGNRTTIPRLSSPRPSRDLDKLQLPSRSSLRAHTQARRIQPGRASLQSHPQGNPSPAPRDAMFSVTTDTRWLCQMTPHADGWFSRYGTSPTGFPQALPGGVWSDASPRSCTGTWGARVSVGLRVTQGIRQCCSPPCFE
jgi:hypothetical protein